MLIGSEEFPEAAMSADEFNLVRKDPLCRRWILETFVVQHVNEIVLRVSCTLCGKVL